MSNQNPLTKEKKVQDYGFPGEFNQTFKELMPVLITFPEEKMLPNSCCKVSIILIPKSKKLQEKKIRGQLP